MRLRRPWPRRSRVTFSVGVLARSITSFGIAGADRDLVHIDVGRVEQPALLGDREHRERVGPGLGADRRAFERIERDVDLRAGALRVPTFSPMNSIGASSRSPSPITTVPSKRSLLSASRIASTAAWSAAFSSPRPISVEAAIAAASVTRTISSTRTRSRSWLAGSAWIWAPFVCGGDRGGGPAGNHRHACALGGYSTEWRLRDAVLVLALHAVTVATPPLEPQRATQHRATHKRTVRKRTAARRAAPASPPRESTYWRPPAVPPRRLRTRPQRAVSRRRQARGVRSQGARAQGSVRQLRRAPACRSARARVRPSSPPPATSLRNFATSGGRLSSRGR